MRKLAHSIYPHNYFSKTKSTTEGSDQERITNLGKIIRKTFPYILKDDQIFQNTARFVTIYIPKKQIFIYEWFNVNTKLSVIRDFINLFFFDLGNFQIVDGQYDLIKNLNISFDDDQTLRDVTNTAKQIPINLTNKLNISQIFLSIIS